jgi:hypothetical protein
MKNPEDYVFLKISEEYGFQSWYAFLTNEEFEEAKRRWQTIKGLNCLVPVQFIFPQAKMYDRGVERWNLRFTDERFQPEDYEFENIWGQIAIVCAHVHQSDDSYLDCVEYEIPESDYFEMDGKIYSDSDITTIRDGILKNLE